MAHKNSESSNSFENKSLEELHKQIEKSKRKISRSIVFAIAALIAIIAIGVAWFVSNTRVKAGLGTISAKYSGIEIGSTGQKGVHDDFLQKVKAAITYHLPDGDSDKKHDTSQGGSINWLLGTDSNMNNYVNGKTFEEISKEGENEKTRKDYAMEPGTKGKLDFFIKSYDEGALSLDFSLNITPSKVADAEPITVLADSIEAKLLSGHILYFLGEKQSDNTVKYTWIKDETFTITIPDAKKDTEYNYSIYWVWPLSLSTVLLNTGDEFLNENKVEFDDKDPSGGLRNQIVSDMSKNPEKYFFSSLTGQPLDKEYTEVKVIPDIHKSSGTNTGYDKQLFVDLSSYYNQADMKIGGGISFVTVTLEYLGKKEVTGAKNED